MTSQKTSANEIDMSKDQGVIYEGNDFYIKKEGTQLVAITRSTTTEYSRLDIKTKKAIHWYARKMCERIYYWFPREEQPLHILCLGSAMGALPYELLSHYPTSTVTCVDIDHESLYVIEKSVLKEFGSRVLYYEGDARLFLEEAGKESFDIVINDLFTEQSSPPFIHSLPFLRSIFHILKPEGLYLANTITNVFDYSHSTAIEKVGYDTQRFSKRSEGRSNIVYEARKD